MSRQFPSHLRSNARSQQQGAALITGLIFLVVLTMIGITAARMSTLEERMSGNMRDRSLAMQAAEMALRDAELELRELGTRTIEFSAFSTNCNTDNDIGTNDDGLCNRGTTIPTYTNDSINFPALTGKDATGGALAIAELTINLTEEESDENPTVAYGTYTGADDIPMVAEQPRYIITVIEKSELGNSLPVYYFVITVRAVGANDNTVIWLQEVFRD